MAMMWFGPADAEPPHDPRILRADTPVGECCRWCREAIAEADRGLLVRLQGEAGVIWSPWHHECFLRNAVGGLNHVEERCTCPLCQGDQPADPPEMTRREAARAAVAAWEAKFRPPDDSVAA